MEGGESRPVLLRSTSMRSTYASRSAAWTGDSRRVCEANSVQGVSRFSVEGTKLVEPFQAMICCAGILIANNPAFQLIAGRISRAMSTYFTTIRVSNFRHRANIAAG